MLRNSDVRMCGYAADHMEDICGLPSFDAYRHGDLKTQSSTIDVRLYLVSLSWMTCPATVPQVRQRDEGRTCSARSRSDFVATYKVGMWSRLYCCWGISTVGKAWRRETKLNLTRRLLMYENELVSLESYT